MTVAHLDCASGVSGDMWLGALVDAGASVERVQEAVDLLGVGDVRLTVARVRRAGMAAASVRVRPPQETPSARTWADIRSILEDAGLADGVRDRCHAVFRRLAEAEAAVHGVPVDEVHFHEVGALDTLGDVVGTVAAVDDLGLERLTVGPVTTGTGTVDTAHGRIPVPVPAVLRLLTGHRLVGSTVTAELVTPTGAALLAELTTPVPAMPPLLLTGVGVGAGGRDLDHPNVLRILVGQPVPDDMTAADAGGTGAVPRSVLEATVDDLSPELVPVVLDHLRDAGAHDAWATPVLMKKGRPGYTLTAIAPDDRLEPLRAVLFRESSTIGCRWWPVQREELPRDWVTVSVHGGEVRVKVARHGGQVVSVAPEADDVRSVSETSGTPARRVHADAEQAARAQIGAP